MAAPHLHVAITSYERREMLEGLMAQILQYRGQYHLDIRLYDDASSFSLEWAREIPEVTVWQADQNHGKEYFWLIWQRLAADAASARYDYFFSLQDDCRLIPNFFDRAIRTWEAIPDRRKTTLMLLLDESRRGRTIWTEHEPELLDLGDVQVWHTQWVDCLFMSDGRWVRRFGGVAEVPQRRWASNPSWSSGVGTQITQWLNELGWRMYQVAGQSLVIHEAHESKLNPQRDEADRKSLTSI